MLGQEDVGYIARTGKGPAPAGLFLYSFAAHAAHVD